MAISSIGYDGSISEDEWARYAPLVGVPPCVVTGAAPSIVSGSDRTVRIPAGTTLWGHGVLDDVEDNTDLQAASVVSGSRWDTVVARRDWTENQTSLAIVQGTSVKAVATLTNNTPGEIKDDPVALIRAQAGMTALQEVVDLRYYAGRVMWRRYIPPAAELDFGTLLVTEDPPSSGLLDLKLRLAGSPGTEWLAGLNAPLWSDLSSVLLSGHAVWSSDAVPMLWRGGGRVSLTGTVKRTSGEFVAGTNYQILALGSVYAPAQQRIFSTAASFNADGVSARVVISTTGTVTVVVPYNTDWIALDGCSWYPKGTV